MSSVVIVPRDFGTWYQVIVDDIEYDKFLNHGPPLSGKDMKDVASYYKEGLDTYKSGH